MRTAWIAAGMALVVGLAGCSIAPRDNAPSERDDDFGTVDVYTVQADGRLEPQARGLAADVWTTFTRVATVDFAADVVTEFRVGDAPESDTLAYVYQDRDPEYWVLAANLATSDDPTQLIATLVHEYGHILTLATDEVDPDGIGCVTIELEEGCAGEASLLWQFEQAFWAGYPDAPNVSNTDPDVAWDFYYDHEDDFVSDYAATNVVEDIAETFMTFVLEDEPDGDSVIASKLLFFWGYPEMVAIRERIRDEFTEELGL